jgi:hypothetical protein
LHPLLEIQARGEKELFNKRKKILIKFPVSHILKKFKINLIDIVIKYETEAEKINEIFKD